MVNKIGIMAVIITLVVVASIGGYLLIKEEPEEEKVFRVGVLWAGGDALASILDSFKEKMMQTFLFLDFGAWFD